MGIKTWSNGESGAVVRKIIEDNFKFATKHLNKTMLSLSTEERLTLNYDYLSDGLLVYDTTKNAYFKYIAKSKSWEKQANNCFVYNFTVSKWKDNAISIPFEEHTIPNPNVQVFILNSNNYEPVFGGFQIDNEFNIILLSDLPFDGKVVVK